MTRRNWQRIGMGIFMLAVGIFLSLTFVVSSDFSKVNFNKDLVTKYPGLINYIDTLLDVPPAKGYFEVGSAIDKFNDETITEHGIPQALQDEILKAVGSETGLYDQAFVKMMLGEGARRTEITLEYSGWMMSRDWEKVEFESILRGKFIEINNTIVGEYGVSEGSRNDVIAAVLEAAAPGWLNTGWMALLVFGLGALGGLVYIIPDFKRKSGVHNNGIYHDKMQTRDWPAWVVLACLVGWYIVLYQFPGFISNQIALLDPLARLMSGGASGRWFLYGFLYTLAMGVLGIRMLVKYRGNAYQQVRTGSVLFFQVVFAFTLPQVMTRLQMPAYDLKSAWPLEYTFFFDYRINEMMQAGTLGVFMLGWGIVLFAVGVPLFTYFFGKRWYCSWVCGCGGLAETVGDPYRHLSDKRLGAWKIERWLVHGVLVFAVVMTVLVAYTSFTSEPTLMGINSYSIRSTYGFFIGFVFAGAVGTGFYPIMGNRVWCRFGCPLAAYLGLVQRFKSRFRITTNGGQCISCGNCSTHCEMGIDVRWYAQRGQNIVRSSCVGCGVCSSVCPRGVLKLENKDESGRINDNPILIGRDTVTLNM